MGEQEVVDDVVDLGLGLEEQPIGVLLEREGTARSPLEVRLSKELITLLSEQLYTSPSKAIEELVVNSFDADAPECWVFVPGLAPGTDAADVPAIAVYDNGIGMDEPGLTDLWRVGASQKRDEQVARQRQRQQIGKFGIGKLATYALASRITYVTSRGDGTILSVTLSFSDFQSGTAGEADTPVRLPVTEVTTESLTSLPTIQTIMRTNGIEPSVALAADGTWTLVLLEEFKSKVESLSPGRLRWVLSTAMPLSGFKVYLNGDLVESSKAAYAPVANLQVADLPEKRLERLREKTGVTWTVREWVNGEGVTERALASALLPNGISGSGMVTEKTIYGGKSRDLIRSHGFFVRVRGRLIAEDDPLFGNPPLTYEVFNRFRADVDVDDLDEDITAPREGAVSSERVAIVQDVLLELFYELRTEYEKSEKEKFKQETRREDERNYVYPRYVERPLADALVRAGGLEGESAPKGGEADETWFYLKLPESSGINELAAELYETTSRKKYSYRLEDSGRDQRLVQFDAASRSFVVNSEHELAVAFKDNKAALDLLYDVATAETLLEVYLREMGVSPALVGELLERRDGLFRSLAREQVSSPSAIAAALRSAIANERDLEIALVVAARALGFVAKHVGNGGRADGLARFSDYANGERKITLEAKSSVTVPSLGAIDFAGLAQHVKDEQAEGCLLVAPSYPGGSRGEDAAAALRAAEQRISCWTVDQLAQVVESLTSKDITARAVLDIVTTKFSPSDVTRAVADLLSDPRNAPREVARQILSALRKLEDVQDRVRSLDMIIGTREVSARSDDVARALEQLAGASAGSITLLSEGRFLLNTSVEELERRTSEWASNDASSRRASTFRHAEGHHEVLPSIEGD